MSKTIDEKVVSMQFDNSKFERNVSTSMSTLDKLKNSLKLDGASKGLEEVNGQARNMNFNPLKQGIETVSAKFSALQIAGVTALANIVNSAVDAGKKIVSALTVDPVMDGFREYEMVLGAVQTTMAGTGKTSAEVEEELKRLDYYADQTVYSTSDMLNNLPKFTNTGVELDKAVTAMIGIANATALAGGDAGKASIAFYNLGQAIGTGYLTRMDYNSINNAGIATMEWKKQMTEAAIAQGSLVKVGEDQYEANGKLFTIQSLFIDGLQEQWATTEVMMKVFGDYGNVETEIGKKAQASAQDVKTFTDMMESLKATAGTGWKDTWQLIFGDLEEAKKMWTNVSNVVSGIITNFNDRRNELLSGWKEGGGRDMLIESFKNAYEGLQTIIKPIKEAFQEVFPPMTSERLLKFTEGLKNLTEKLKLSGKQSENLKRTFKGLFSIFDILKQAVVAVFDAVKPLLGLLPGAGDGILGVTANIGDAITKLSEYLKKNQTFKKAIEKTISFVQELSDKVNTAFENLTGITIGDAFEIIKDKIVSAVEKIKEALTGIKDADTSGIESFTDKIKTKFAPVITLFEGFKSIFSGIAAFFKKIAPLLSSVVSAIGRVLKTAGESLSEVINEADYEKLFNLVNGGVLVAIGIGLKKFIDGLRDITGNTSGILGSVKEIFDQVGGALESWQQNLQAKTLITIAGAIALLTASIVVLSLIDSKKLGAALAAITTEFIVLFGSMAIFTKIVQSDGFAGMAKLTVAMVALASAVLILSFAVKNLSSLSWDELLVGLTGVGVLCAALVISMKTLTTSEKKIFSTAVAMVIFASAIKILASACISLSSLSWEELAKGLVGVGVLLTAVGVFLNNAKFQGKAILTATGIVILAAAMKILASACADFAKMDWEQLAKGLSAIGALMVAFAAFSKLSGNAVDTLAASASLIAVAAAMKILASAMVDFAVLDWDQIGRSLAAMGGSLIILAIALKMMNGTLTGSAALTVAAASLLILAPALQKFSAFNWDEITRGLVALGGSLLILAIALKMMNGTLLGSAALAVAAASLLLLAPALKQLGSMSWQEIGMGLVALAGALAVLGIAGYLLAPVAPVIVTLALAFVLLSGAVIGIGAGILLIASAITMLATISEAGAASIALSITSLGTALIGLIPVLVKTLISLIPIVVQGIGQLIIEICKVVSESAYAIGAAVKDTLLAVILTATQVITESASAIGEAIKVIIFTLLDIILECLPSLVDGVMNIFTQLLVLLGQYIPKIVEGLYGLITDVLTALAELVPSFLETIFNFLTSMLGGIADFLSTIDISPIVESISVISQSIFTSLSAIIQPLVETIALLFAPILDVISDIFIKIAPTIADGLAKVLAVVLPALPPIIEAFSVLAEAIGNAIALIIEALTPFVEVIGNCIARILEIILPSLPPIIEAIAILVEAVGNAVSSIITALTPVIEILAELIANIVQVMADAIVKIMEILAPYIPNIQAIIETLATVFQSVCDVILAIVEQIAPIIDSISSLLAELGETIKIIFDGICETLRTCGDVISEVLQSMSDTFSTVFNGISEVLESVGGAISSVLDSIAGVIESIGEAALDTGEGFKKLAEGIKTITKLNIVDMAASLAAVAVGIKDIAANSDGIYNTGTGMKLVSESLSTSSGSLATLSITISEIITKLISMGTYALDSADRVSQFTKVLTDIFTYIKTSASVAAAQLYILLGSITAIANKSAELALTADSMWKISDSATKSSAAFGRMLASVRELNAGLETIGSTASVISNISSIVNKASVDISKIAETSSSTSEVVALSTAKMSSSFNLFNSALSDASNNVKASMAKMASEITGSITSIMKTISSMKNEFVQTFNLLIVAALKVITDSTKMFKTTGVALMSNFKEGIVTGSTQIIPLLEMLITKAIKIIDSKKREFLLAGKELMVYLANGIKNSSSEIPNSFTSILNNSITSIENYKDDFKDAGEELVKGFANGISENTFRAEAQAVAMAAAALEAAKEELLIESPSKKFEEIGKYTTMGFATGIKKFGGLVKDQASSLANTAVNATTNALSRISDVTNSDIDIQPTIRPVLDMSNLNTSSVQLSADVSAFLVQPIDSLSQIISDAQYAINTSNRELLTAINGLRDDLGSLYNMVDNKDTNLYLDTKKVASSLAKPMNRELNNLSKRGAYANGLS